MTIHQPGRPRKDKAGNRNPRLKQLAANYAIRTRLLSEAVATLCLQIIAGREFREQITEVERLQVLMEQASADLLAVIDPPIMRAAAASAGAGGWSAAAWRSAEPPESYISVLQPSLEAEAPRPRL